MKAKPQFQIQNEHKIVDRPDYVVLEGQAVAAGLAAGAQYGVEDASEYRVEDTSYAAQRKWHAENTASFTESRNAGNGRPWRI